MDVKAIKTNFTELDNVIGGFFPGELTVDYFTENEPSIFI